MREFVKEYAKGTRQENMHSKTKYAVSLRPILITASSDDSQDITAAFQTLDANATFHGRTVRVQTIYLKEDMVALRHDPRRKIRPFWFAVLLEDIQVEVQDRKF